MYVEPDELLFELKNGGRMKVTQKVILTFKEYQQHSLMQKEAGGILLGRFIKYCNDIVIDEITVPLPGDIQSRFSFKRLSTLHQQILQSAWIASKQSCNYLGEWHTHPESYPQPSGVDMSDWKKKLNKGKFSNRFLYFFIVGTETINVWEGDRQTSTISQLKASE